MTPSLSLIARIYSERSGTSERELRLSDEVQAEIERAEFAWLADQLSDVGASAIALWLGVSESDVLRLIRETEARRADTGLTERLDDIALEIYAEHLTRDRLGKLRPERSLQEIAHAVLSRRCIAGGAEIRDLAAGFLALAAELEEARQNNAALPPPVMPPLAADRLEEAARAVSIAYLRQVNALYSPRERSARHDLETTLIALGKIPGLLPVKETTNG